MKITNKLKTLSESDFSIRLFSSPLTYPWIVVFICMIFGAILGFIGSLFLPPIYEARSVVTTNMEIVQNTNITEIMVDAEINHIGELVFHPKVIQLLLESEAAYGNVLNLELLKENSTIERQLMNTVIKVRHQNPQIAARIASNWGAIFFDTLSEAYEHAVILSNAKTQLKAIEACFDTKNTNELPVCASLDQAKLQTELDRLGEIIRSESPQSLGLTVDLNVSQYQPAAIPENPQRFHRGTLMLVGGLVGFLAAFVLVELTGFGHARHEEK